MGAEDEDRIVGKAHPIKKINDLKNVKHIKNRKKSLKGKVN